MITTIDGDNDAGREGDDVNTDGDGDEHDDEDDDDDAGDDDDDANRAPMGGFWIPKSCEGTIAPPCIYRFSWGQQMSLWREVTFPRVA